MAEVRTTSETGGMKGVKLERFDLIPVGPLWDLATLYGRGAAKYVEHNFRKGYEWSKSYSALQRHANAWARGESWDVCPVPVGEHEDCITSHPETGESTTFKTPNGRMCYNHTGAHHMIAVAWHAFALREFENTHPGFDDRYIARPYVVEMDGESSDDGIRGEESVFKINKEHHSYSLESEVYKALRGNILEERTPVRLLNSFVLSGATGYIPRPVGIRSFELDPDEVYPVDGVAGSHKTIFCYGQNLELIDE